MSITRLIAVTSAAAVLALPSVALAAGPPANPGGGHKPAGTDHPTPASKAGGAEPTADATPGTTAGATPPPSAPVARKAKAYGKYCHGQSKEHVKGEKGTAFSRCVTAMAKAATGRTDSARTACAGMSKKQTHGKGTPYSRCVVEAAKLVKD